MTTNPLQERLAAVRAPRGAAGRSDRHEAPGDGDYVASRNDARSATDSSTSELDVCKPHDGPRSSPSTN